MALRTFSIAMTAGAHVAPPAFATGVPALFEVLLDVFAPLDVTFQLERAEPVRVARLDPARAFQTEPLWCDEELTRGALTRCSPTLGADVIAELYDRLAGAAPARFAIAAHGALHHHAPGTAEPAWYGRWRSAQLTPLATVTFAWPARALTISCPASGYPFTAVRPLVRGTLAGGDPALAAANRAAILPVLGRAGAALGFDRDEVTWATGGDYGAEYPADRADVFRRWLPVLRG